MARRAGGAAGAAVRHGQRQHTIEVLSEAFAQGELEMDDFERRVEVAHRATTAGELDGLVSGLSSLSRAQAPQLPQGQERALSRPQWVERHEGAVRRLGLSAGILGGMSRRGRWVPARHNVAVGVMGGCSLDFREAAFPPGVTEVYVLAVWGGVEIIVPPWLRVETSGLGILGGFDHGHDAPAPARDDPDAPVLHISGLALMGGVEVVARLPGESAKEARKRLKEERSGRKRLPVVLAPLAWGLVAGAAGVQAQAPPPPAAQTPTPAEAPAPSFRIRGTVVDGGDGTPLAFAEVALAGTPRRVLTDGLGRFEVVGVPVGPAALEVRRMGFADGVAELTVRADTAVTIALEPAAVPLAAIVVTPGFFGVMSQTMATRQTLTRQQIETAPQLGEDIFRAVSRIPGVATADISAGFGVRGSRPDEVLVRLDGLELYEPFHLKDFDNAISIIDVAAVGGVELMTGGAGGQYGDRSGGVFDIRSAAVAPGRTRTEMGLSITAARAGSQGTFAQDRGRWLVSLRRGYLDLALKLTKAEDNVSPTYYDLFGKVEYDVGRSTLSAHVLHAYDTFEYDDGPNDPVINTRYGSSYAWLGWRGPLAGSLSQQTTLATGRLTWKRDSEPGPGRRAMPVGLSDVRTFDFLALHQDWMQEWSDWTLTRFGGHVRTLSANYDYEGWRRWDFPEAGVLVQRTDSTVVRMDPEGSALDGWLVQRVRVAPFLTVEAGVHWGQRSYSGESDWSPRVDVAFSPHPRTTVRASWGRQAQAQGIYELSVRDGEDQFAPAELSEQRVVGIEHMHPAGVTLRVEAYDRRLESIRPRWVNLDFPDDWFPEMARARLRLEPTEGRAQGVEFSAGRQGQLGWSWSGSYVLARVDEQIDGRTVPRARDQRHSLGLDAAFSPNERWRFSAAWQGHSGWPRTDADFRVERLLNGRPFVHWDYAPYNSGRLPAYHRLDTRITRHIETASGGVSIFLDLFNAYDRSNYRAITVYSRTDSAGNVRRSERAERFLPRLPSLGVIWQF